MYYTEYPSWDDLRYEVTVEDILEICENYLDIEVPEGDIYDLINDIEDRMNKDAKVDNAICAWIQDNYEGETKIDPDVLYDRMRDERMGL